MMVAPDKPGGVYQVGDTVHWVVEWKGGTNVPAAHYILKSGGQTDAGQGNLTFSNDVATLESKFDQPNTMLVEVRWQPENDTNRAVGGAVAAPDKILPAAPPPADFDAFWKAKLKELAARPHRGRATLRAVITGGRRLLLPLGAIYLQHRLQQLPADHAIRLDDRPEVPESDAGADELTGGDHCSRARARVDQGHLAEVVPGPEDPLLVAADEHSRLAGVDHEERGCPGALLDGRFACGEPPLLEHARNPFELVRAQVGEQRHALEHLDRRTGHANITPVPPSAVASASQAGPRGHGPGLPSCPALVTALHCNRYSVPPALAHSMSRAGP